MRVGVVVLDGVFDSGLTALCDVLAAGAALRGSVAPSIAPITVVRVGDPGTSTARTQGGLTVPLEAGWDEVPERCDAVVVPALGGITAEAVLASLRRPSAVRLVEQLRAWAGSDLAIASACTGAFALAEGGLLDGRPATTSWWLAPTFRARYPAVRLEMDAMVVRSGRVRTAGAAFAHLDLGLDLLAGLSPQLADLVARYLVVDRRPAQSAYAVLSHLAQADPLVQEFERYARAHLHEPIDVSVAARQLGTSRRTLERRTRAAVGTSPVGLLQRLRVERARHLARTTALSTDQIADQVGYVNATTLRRLLRRL